MNVLSIDQLNQLAADLVLDANVALKWYLQDEPYQSQANLVRRHWADGQLGLIAPDIIVYEISVGLNKAVRNPRRSIRARDVPGAISSFMGLDLATVSSALLAGPAMRIGNNSSGRIHNPDTLYAARGSLKGIRVLTADEAFYNGLQAAGIPALHIRDYR